ncbi:MAG: ribulose-5-phosphate 4-epimerase [Microbacterium sp.]|nr:ribulose-5-phosphate 4-epimerase [Microbacterium sp.]
MTGEGTTRTGAAGASGSVDAPAGVGAGARADTPAGAPTDALSDARIHVAAVCRALAADGLVKGTAGNVSVRVDEGIAITATGVVFADAVADDVVIVGDDRRLRQGSLAPSSELDLHLAAYADDAVEAVVHTHAPAAVAVSLISDRLPCVHYQQLTLGGEIEVVPFSVFGSRALAEATGDALSSANAVILAHHGAVTTGRDLADAVAHTALLEWACDIYLRARAAGEPAELSPAQQADVVAAAVATGYGQKHEA